MGILDVPGLSKAQAQVAAASDARLEKWFSGGLKGKKIVLVGDSTTDFAYALNRALFNYYGRTARELDGVAVLNYGINGGTLAAWITDTGRYGAASTVAANADLYVLCYGVNDVRLGALSEDGLTTLLGQAVDLLTANGATVLLRTPAGFTASDTGTLGFVSPETPTAAQTYSTLMRNAYIRTAIAKGCPLLDSQAKVFGLTSKTDVLSPYMLNQLHPNDAGNIAVARELVRIIGQPTTQPAATFAMRGVVGVGSLGKRVLPSGGKVAFGYANYKPTLNSGTVTLEIRKYLSGSGTYSVLGTASYSGGYTAGNVFNPQSAITDWNSFAAGDTLEVAVTVASVQIRDLDVFMVIDEPGRASYYPLRLRYNGLVDGIAGTVIYPASQGLPATLERDIRGLKAIKISKLGTNRFTSWSQDASQASAWTVLNATVAGSVGNQTITATTTSGLAALNAPAVGGETLTFSWQVTVNTGTPRYAVYDVTHGAYVTSPTVYPAADGSGWRTVTFTVPAGCTVIRCYIMASTTIVGDNITLTGMQLTAGATFSTYTPTNKTGTSMVINTGALPTEMTLIRAVKVDSSSGIGIVGPGGNTDGNPALQATNGNVFGFPIITTRGTATMGALGTWQVSILRATGGNVYVSVNDQASSPAYAKAVNASDLSVNLLNSSDATGLYQNWNGEIIEDYYPYLLTDGEATARAREILRTLLAAGETVTADWPSERLV